MNMSFPFRPLLFCLSIFVLATAGGGKASATKLHLINMVDLVNMEDAAFLETLAQSLRDAAKHTLDDFTVDEIDFVRADLNGDGVEEFIVQASTSYTCGNKPTCHASVYRKTQEGWRFVGNIGTISYPGVIYIEDTWSNGWRTTHNENFRDCWVNETDPRRQYSNYDIMGMPMAPGQAGYFFSVALDETCPEKNPYLEK